MAGVRTRKRGKSWYYAFEAKTLNCERKIVEKGGFKSERDAINAGIKALASYKCGNIAFVSEKISLGDFLNAWLEVKAKEVRPKTIENYQHCVKKIIPIIGNIGVQKLRPRDVDAAITMLANEGLSKGTLSLILTILKDALNYAVYPCEFLQSNPAALIKAPKFAPKKVVKREVIDDEKLSELFTAFPFGDPLHMPLQIAYHTGMRIGEVLGLCWDAVDLKKGRIRVIRQLQYTSAIGYYFGEPKTSTSVRSVLLDGEIVSLLKQWKAKQAENELAIGAAYFRNYEDKNGRLWQMSKNMTPPENFVLRPLVCVNEKGKSLSHSVIKAELKKQGVNSHSLRHTHATKLIEGGAIPKDVAARLGHADATITQNLYTHDTEEMQRDTLRIFEKMLAK